MVSAFEAAEQRLIAAAEDFQDPSQEWRRLFSELLGTFFLVLVAAGGGMMGQAFPDTISRTAAVRRAGTDGDGDHPVHGQGLRRAPQPGGQPRVRAPRRLPVASRPRLHRRAARRRDARLPVPAARSSTCRPPTAPTTRRRGTRDWRRSGWRSSSRWGWSASSSAPRRARRTSAIFGAFGVGGYIALAGLWGSPISGTSMNPARTFGPDLVGADFTAYWVYVAGPILGAVIAVGCAFVLRGKGGGRAGSAAAQGALFTEARHPEQN